MKRIKNVRTQYYEILLKILILGHIFIFCLTILTIYPGEWNYHFISHEIEIHSASIGRKGSKFWSSIDLCGSCRYLMLAPCLFTSLSMILSFSIYKMGIITLLRTILRIRRTCMWVCMFTYTHITHAWVQTCMHMYMPILRVWHVEMASFWCSVKKSCHYHSTDLRPLLSHSLT